MARYTTYGLNVESELMLPELVSEQTQSTMEPHVSVRLGSFDRNIPSGAKGSAEAWAGPDVAMLGFEDVGYYLINGGREVVIDRHPQADDDSVRLFLLGPVLGALLHQRGFLVLHGSAAAIGAVAVGFVADKGTGKSTLAAAFCAQGHSIIADDLIAVDLLSPGGPLVYPGFPQLKLFPEAAAQLDERPAELPRLAPNFDKRARRVAESFAAHPLPLARIYALADGEDESIERLSPHRSFLETVRHTFVLSMLRATGEQASHFRQAVHLTGLLPISLLKRRRLISVLPEVVKLVERDLQAA